MGVGYKEGIWKFGECAGVEAYKARADDESEAEEEVVFDVICVVLLIILRMY